MLVLEVQEEGFGLFHCEKKGDKTEWEATWLADMLKPMLLGSVIR